jgi:type VI secretion system protein VasI
LTIAAVKSAIAADCLRNNEPLDRLPSYDQKSARTAQQKNLTGPGSWTVTESKSKIDDSPSIMLTVQSSEPVRSGYKQEKADLVLRCHENNTSIYVVFGGCYMSGNSVWSRVDIRLDNDKAFSQEWTESDGNKALGLWRYGKGLIGRIKGMFGKSKMLVQASPTSESSMIAEFSIAGIQEAVKPLQKACNWGGPPRTSENNPLCKIPDKNLIGLEYIIQAIDY